MALIEDRLRARLRRVESCMKEKREQVVRLAGELSKDLADVEQQARGDGAVTRPFIEGAVARLIVEIEGWQRYRDEADTLRDILPR